MELVTIGSWPASWGVWVQFLEFLQHLSLCRYSLLCTYSSLYYFVSGMVNSSRDLVVIKVRGDQSSWWSKFPIKRRHCGISTPMKIRFCGGKRKVEFVGVFADWGGSYRVQSVLAACAHGLATLAPQEVLATVGDGWADVFGHRWLAVWRENRMESHKGSV